MIQNDTNKKVEYGAWVSIVAYTFLSVLKLLLGYYLHSEALSADGLNNSTDIILSIAILIGIRISKRPPDADHTYGHSKAESIAALVASFIMVSVGLDIILKSFKQVFIHTPSTAPDSWAAWIAIFCAIVMYLVYRYNHALAIKTKSQALLSAAKDNLSDVWVSVGASIGIFGAQFNMPWLDPLAAIIVGIMICKTAWEIFRESTHMLTDGFDEGKLPEFKETIKAVHGVTVVETIKARNYGPEIFVDVTIHVDPKQDIVKCHAICDEIEKIMLRKHLVANVHIHMEPDKKLLSSP